MKKRNLFLVGFVIFCALYWAGSPSAQATPSKPIVLSLSSAFVPGSADHARSTWFMEEVTRRSGGLITFRTFWGGALAPPVGQLDLVRKGVVDIICTSLGYWPGLFPFSGFTFTFPFGPEDPTIIGTAFRRTMDAFPQYAKHFADMGVVNLSNSTRSFYELMSVAPAKSLADMKGRKVGVIGRFFAMWLEAGGLVPVVQPSGERYMSLHTKLIDMSTLPVAMDTSWKIHEVARFRINVGLGTYLNEGLLMSALTFNKLSPEFQKIILDVGIEAERFLWEHEIKQHAVTLEILRKAGVTFIDLPKADREKWIAAVPDTTLEIIKILEAKGFPGSEMVRRYQEELAKLGFKWPRVWGVKK